MRNCLNDILNENCLLTLAQINQELRQRLPRKPTIHDRTVARTLEGMLYRVKLARPLPVERNRPDVLQKRVDYANWFMRHAVVNHSIFVDERGYNIWTARSHGRARMGTSTSMWSAREKCYCSTGNFTHQWTSFSLGTSRWNEWTFNDFLSQARLNVDPNEYVISFMTAHQPTTILPLWYRFMQTYLLRCLNNEEIEGKLQNMTLQYTVIEQYEISFSPVDCYYYTRLSVHVNDWSFWINDCMKV